MDYQEYRQIRKNLSAIRVNNELYGLISEGIQQLLALLNDLSDGSIRWHVWSDLAAQSIRIGRNDLCILFCRKKCDEFPDDPISHASLGYHLGLLGADNPSYQEESVNVAKAAFHMALKQSRMVKYCGTNLARIALMAGDYLALHYAISELVRVSDIMYEEDYRYEFDFIDKIDPDRFDNELLMQYKNLEKNSGDIVRS